MAGHAHRMVRLGVKCDTHTKLIHDCWSGLSGPSHSQTRETAVHRGGPGAGPVRVCAAAGRVRKYPRNRNIWKKFSILNQSVVYSVIQNTLSDDWEYGRTLHLLYRTGSGDGCG
jgi:hypothetical protein